MINIQVFRSIYPEAASTTCRVNATNKYTLWYSEGLQKSSSRGSVVQEVDFRPVIWV